MKMLIYASKNTLFWIIIYDVIKWVTPHSDTLQLFWMVIQNDLFLQTLSEIIFYRYSEYIRNNAQPFPWEVINLSIDSHPRERSYSEQRFSLPVHDATHNWKYSWMSFLRQYIKFQRHQAISRSLGRILLPKR